MSADENNDRREPVPRAWREEFDGIKPIRAHRRSKPAATAKVARDDLSSETGKDDE